MTILIAILSALAYGTGTVRYTRWRYMATRPYTEPVACDQPYHRNGTHMRYCYRRNERTLIDTSGEALTFALLLGLAWPFVLICLFTARLALRIGWLIAGDRELPEEAAFRIAHGTGSRDEGAQVTCLYCFHPKRRHYVPGVGEWPRLIRCADCPEGWCRARG